MKPNGPSVEDAARLQGADDARTSFSEGEHLASAAMALLGCRSEDDVYRVIGDFMAALCPEALIVVDEITPDMGFFITRLITGADASMLSKAAGLVGFDIVGKRWPIPPPFRDELLSGALMRIPGGFAELASSEIPRPIATALTRAFGIHDLFAIGIADGKNALGNFAVVTRTPDVVLPTHIVESFARHCYSALDAIRKDRDLAASAESNRLVLYNMVEGLALHEIILDESGKPCDYRFLEVNPAYEAQTGLKGEDIIGRTVLEVVPGTEPVWIERYGAVATTGISARFEEYASELGRYYEISAYSPEPGQFVSVGVDITDRKLAEAALRESEEHLRRLFDRDPDGIIVLDPETTRPLEFNTTAHEQLGYTREEFAALRVSDIEDMETPEETRAHVDQVLREGRADFETRHRTKTGELRDVRVTAQTLYVAGELVYHCIWRDVTESRRVQRALKLSEEKFAIAFHTSLDAVNINRLSDGLYLDVNEGFTALTGYSADDVAGKTSRDISIWYDLADRERLLAGLRADGAVRNLEAQFRRKDGSVTTALMSARVIEIDGENCIISVTRDISDRKRLEEALQHRLVALTQPPAATDGLSFTDLFNVEEIQSVQDAFSAATGVASIIVKPDGVPITRPSNYSYLCAEIIQGTEKGRANCLASDASIGCGDSSGPVVRHCLSAGLWDAGASIHAGGEHVANWLIAQVRDEDQHDAELLAYADEIGAERDEFEAALAQLPVMSRGKFELIAEAMSSIADELSVIAYQNVQQARFITERARIEKELDEEQKRGLARLSRSLASIIEVVSLVSETRDPYTAGHQRRVSELAVRIARGMGMTAEQTEEIRIAGLLHDVGKMSIPAEILSKPGKLLPIEYELIKAHSEAGYRIIASADMEGNVAEIVYQHHERCDGSGYPRGLKADELLPESKVLMVADVVEAMISHRPYRPGLGVEAALSEIESGSGTLYDTDVVEACVRAFHAEGFEFSEE